jgi:hypothetical protein
VNLSEHITRRDTSVSTDTTVEPDTTTSPEQRPWDQQLAIPRTSMWLRTEVVKDVHTDDGEHTVIDPRTVTWSDAQDAFEDYLQEKRNFANAPWCDFDHRFTRDWCCNRYAELGNVDRWCQQNFNNLHTVWMTLNGDKRNDGGGWRCGLDFTNELLQSNGKVGTRINTHLDNRFARFTVLGAHKHGYPHVHWGFYVEGRPSREPFMRALHGHLNNSPVAVEAHHPDDAISIEQANPDSQYDRSDTDVPVTRLMREASSQLLWPDSGVDVSDAPAHKRRFATLLWASQYTYQWRTGDTFDKICDSEQEAWAKRHSDAEDESETDGFDYSELDNPTNPAVKIDAHDGWDTSIDPLEHE